MHTSFYLSLNPPEDLLKKLEHLLTLANLIEDKNIRLIATQYMGFSTDHESLKTLNNNLQENSDIDIISSLISRDMYLTARILQLANFITIGEQSIYIIKDAVKLVGIDRLKSIIAQQLTLPEAPQNLEALWTHSFRVAYSAMLIAANENLADDTIQKITLADLLHDIGELCLRHSPSTIHDHALHSLVSAYLLGIWGVDRAIVSSVAAHHFHLKNIDFDPLLAKIMSFSDWFDNTRFKNTLEHSHSLCIEGDDKYMAWNTLLTGVYNDSH